MQRKSIYLLFLLSLSTLSVKSQIDSLTFDSDKNDALRVFACEYLYAYNLLDFNKKYFSYSILRSSRGWIPYGIVENVIEHEWIYLVTDTTSFLVEIDKYGTQSFEITKSQAYQCPKFSKRRFLREWFGTENIFMGNFISVKDVDRNWRDAFSDIFFACNDLVRPVDKKEFHLSKIYKNGQGSLDQVLYFRSGNGWNMYEIVKIGATDRALCECMLKGLNEESDKWKGFSQVSSFYWVF